MPVFKKFIETNRKYASETYEPPEVKSYYVDCISAFSLVCAGADNYVVLECHGLLPREFEARSYMDYIPGLGILLALTLT